MHQWRATPGLKSDAHSHKVAPGTGHALLSLLAGYVFRILGISAAVREHGQVWFPIHNEPNVVVFERGHAVTTERIQHNLRGFAAVTRTGALLCAEHAGFWDLFVPISMQGKMVATLVSGPFSRKPATGSDVLERWQWMTGRRGHLSDPEFSAYLAATLSTLVLDDRGLARFERLLVLIARLMAGDGDAGRLMSEIEVLQIELSELRLVERAWRAVREMVDERSLNTWRGEGANLARLGLAKVADHVLVGLAVSRTVGQDPIDEAIQRNMLQRRAVEVARASGNVIAGQVGDRGVVFLSSAGGSDERKKQRLRELGERVARLARREFGLTLHFGAGVPTRSETLNLSFRAALVAAETALARGERFVVADVGTRFPPLRQLRNELARAIEQGPELLAGRFDRYLEAVAIESSHRLDPARGHLEAGFERIAEPLVGVGALDAKGFSLITDKLERAAAEAESLGNLFSAYRRAVVDLGEALKKPSSARQDRNLRGALEYIHQHYTEPLRLTQIARRAGFAQSHFSKLFIAREGTSFQHYLRKLRVERAKHLLANTDLALGRIAELSGLRSAAYLCRVFRETVRATPLAYRKQSSHQTGNARHRKTTRNAS